MQVGEEREDPSCYNLSIAYDPDITICQKAYLPHWIKEGSVYAVRFRLADSLPREKLELWKTEREELVRKVAVAKKKLTKSEQQRLNQLFSERVEQFLDAGYGACWLKRDDIAQLVANALWYFDGGTSVPDVQIGEKNDRKPSVRAYVQVPIMRGEERYRLLAWCIMPNHLHVVLQPTGIKTLFEILDSWKHFTAREANKILGRKGSFWQSESFDHLIRNRESLEKWINYTWQNPEVAGLKNWKWRWRVDGNLPND